MLHPEDSRRHMEKTLKQGIRRSRDKIRFMEICPPCEYKRKGIADEEQNKKELEEALHVISTYTPSDTRLVIVARQSKEHSYCCFDRYRETKFLLRTVPKNESLVNDDRNILLSYSIVKSEDRYGELPFTSVWSHSLKFGQALKLYYDNKAKIIQRFWRPLYLLKKVKIIQRSWRAYYYEPDHYFKTEIGQKAINSFNYTLSAFSSEVKQVAD